jgi:glycosyltransferase involved in cell wall biosynthesis
MLGCMEGRTTEVFLSVLIPAYNEAAIIERCLVRVSEYLAAGSDAREWELVVVNDGSSDGTGAIIDAFAARDPRVHVLHHGANLGLGAALKTGFEVCRGEVIVTLDADLTYSVDHIDRLVDAYVATAATIVIASPYMSGGEVTAVPRSRLLTSRVANRLLAAASNARLSTYTGMVRAYDARFVRGLTIRANGMEVNAEILRQAQILRARIVEIPAHLDWGASARAAEPALF